MHSSRTCLGVCGHLLMITLILFPPPLFATTITVTDGSSTVADDGACSLREAVTSANTNTASGTLAGECPAGDPGVDTIALTGDVVLTTPIGRTYNGLPPVTEDLILEGNGFTIDRSVPDPEYDLFRFFEVSGAGLDLELNNVTLSNGFAFSGGAISVTDGAHLVLRNSTLLSNFVTGDFEKGGGGISAISASVEIYNSNLNNNWDQAYYPYDGGGGIQGISSDLIIDGTTFSRNVSGYQGGGIHLVGGSLTLTNSTFTLNSDSGIDAESTVVNVSNSTFSKNGFAAALRNSSGSFKNVTVIGSSVGRTSSLIFVDSPTMTVENAIFGQALGNHCAGTFVDAGGNLADAATCGSVPATLTGLDPQLLQNGGPTFTHALLPGSSALDAAGNCGLATDQRGKPRNDGLCDSGAFEGVKASQPKMYVSDDRGYRDSQVFSVDPLTGQDTSIGPVQTLADLETLAYNKATNRLYGITAEKGHLWEIDKATGALSLVCTIPKVRKFREIASSSFHPLTGELWAYQYNRGLVTIDLEDCSLTRKWVHPYGVGEHRKWDAIAWTPDGLGLFATERTSLLRWNPDTESFSRICFGLPDKTEGLEFSPTGQFLGSSGSQIFEVGAGCTATVIYDFPDREDIESLTFE